MKPDWKDAPEWARFLAMEKSGTFYWYEIEPILTHSMWANVKGSLWEPCGYYEPDWRTTLEQRPTDSGGE